VGVDTSPPGRLEGVEDQSRLLGSHFVVILGGRDPVPCARESIGMASFDRDLLDCAAAANVSLHQLE
jgi:hypothetical protein